MSRQISQIMRGPIFFALLALAAMIALSFSLRQNDFTEIAGSQNLEASYHVLLTVKAIDESPARNHLFLPSVSLGNEADKHIPWGVTVPTKTGDYIYTSFNFPGFVAPYLWFKAFNIKQSATNLSYFNALLGSISSLILFALCYGLLRTTGYSVYIASIASALACTVSIFSREALISQGLTYWPQSLYQLILGATLLILYKFLESNKKGTKFHALIALAFIGALTEWSGYVLNAGLVLLLWIGCHDSKECRKLSVWIFAATALAAISTVIHFSAAVGFSPAIEAIVGRFLARSTGAGSIAGLVQGYGQSYGLFLLLVIGIAAVSGFTKSPETDPKRGQVLLMIFLASCIPLIENLVMLQHATAYTFDRLKFIFPAAIIFAFCFARSKMIGRAFLFAASIAASFQGYKSYRADLANYSAWAAIDKSNRVFAEKVKASAASKCAVFVSSIGVRGYANLLFNHGVYEHMTPQDAEVLLRRRHGCELIYIEGSYAFPDLPKYSKATVRKEDGSVEVISSDMH